MIAFNVTNTVQYIPKYLTLKSIRPGNELSTERWLPTTARDRLPVIGVILTYLKTSSSSSRIFSTSCSQDMFC